MVTILSRTRGGGISNLGLLIRAGLWLLTRRHWSITDVSLKTQFSGPWFSGGIGAGLAVVAGWVCLMSPLGQGLEHLSYDLPFLCRSDLKTDEVVIVYIDDESTRKLGQEYHRPLDRSRLARLLDRLTAERARGVVLDLELDQPGTDPQADLRLAEALAANGQVVLGSNLNEAGAYGDARNVKEMLPLELFRRRAAGMGIVRVYEDADRAIRRIYPGHPDLPTVTNSLCWAVAELVGAAATKDPASRWRSRWVNYYGPPTAGIPSVSYYRALDTNDLRRDYFHGRIVFVGAKSGTGFLGDKKDEFRHPYTGWGGGFSSGVEIQATMFLNLLRGDWLRRTSPGIESLTLLVLGVGFGFGLARLRPLKAAGLGLCGVGGVALAALLLMWQEHAWFPWCTVAFVQIPGALAWSVLCAFDRSSRERFAEMSQHHQVVVSSPGRGTMAGADDTTTGPRAACAGPTPTGAVPIPDHRLLNCIGRGSYGEVWLARSVMGFYRAVKIIQERALGDQHPLEREFQGIMKFEPISRLHEGFVDILHVGRNPEAGYFYYVLELADDQISGPAIEPTRYHPKTLRTEIDKRGPLPLEESIEISLSLTSALAFLHRHGLVHRDVKPGNIVFVNGVPKLADIGLVAAVTEARSFVGTEGYLPPEGPGAFQADLFSLGKVLYEMSTGRNAKEFPASISPVAAGGGGVKLPAWHQVVLKACESNLERRYRTATEMEADLRRIQAA